MFYFKLFTAAISFLAADRLKQKEYYYYHNLGLTKLKLWVFYEFCDLLSFVLLLIIKDMERIKKWFCVAVCAAAFGGAAAQDIPGYKKVTLFEGETINSIVVSGDFDVVIRQGTPGGVVLEVPDIIPVNTVYDPLYGDFKWMMQARSWNKELSDTVQCSFADGVLRINNLRLNISSRAAGRINTSWVSGPKGRAVITVGDLRKLQASTKGSLRFAGKIRTTETELQVKSVEGLDLTAEKGF